MIATETTIDIEAIMPYILYLYLFLNISLLFFFIRMSHDIHKLKKKWVDQVRFTGKVPFDSEP